MLGSLATKQRAPRHLATLSNTADNLRHVLRNHLPDSDIVLQKQGFRTTHHKIIDDHRHEILTNRVVLIHRLSHSELRAHAIR